jgi:hypothetical protein
MTIKKLFRPLTLKAYDDKLVNGVVDIWLFFVRLNIAAIAFCDAVAWSHLARITTPGDMGKFAACVVGLIVLVIVGSVDASFVMHDTTVKRRPVALVPGRSRILVVVRWLRQNVRAGHLAILARIALVYVSFTVTAPFLSQLVFSRDIEAAIQHSNEQSQSAKLTEIAATHDAALADMRTKLAQRMRDLETEVAGGGRSGRYGDGPTASAIKRDIEQYTTDIRNAEAAKAAELEAFKKATPRQLASRWGIDVKREGPDTRARVVAEMEKSAAFRSVRNNVRWFLAFMFVSLLVLKCFEGDAVRSYYSADLQAAHDRYLAGIYDPLLHPAERPDAEGGGMTAGQFVRWYNDHQSAAEAHQAVKLRIDFARATSDMQYQGLQSLSATQSATLTNMRADYELATQKKEELERDLGNAKSRLATLRTKIDSQAAELQSFSFDNNDADGDVSLTAGEFLVKRKQIVERQLTANRAAVAETESLVGRLTQQKTDNGVLIERISRSMEDLGRQVANLAQLLAEAQKRSMEGIASVI